MNYYLKKNYYLFYLESNIQYFYYHYLSMHCELLPIKYTINISHFLLFLYPKFELKLIY